MAEVWRGVVVVMLWRLACVCSGPLFWGCLLGAGLWGLAVSEVASAFQEAL